MTSFHVGSLYAETHNSIVRGSLADSERLHGILSQTTLQSAAAWAAAGAPSHNDGPAGDGGDAEPIVMQIRQVAKVIAARQAMQAERDILLIELGNFDTHMGVVGGLSLNFDAMNMAFTAFESEMKAQGVWNQVTLAGISEFGRTMTTNGQGTDHAWGGNYFLFGGDVNGGKIHGTFPELRTDGPDSISSTGQLLPTTPWEGLWKPIASWLGVHDDKMASVMPNLANFPADRILNTTDVFRFQSRS